MTELITQPIKEVLYKITPVIDIADTISSGAITPPTGVVAELASTTTKYTGKIQEVQDKLITIGGNLSSDATNRAQSTAAETSKNVKTKEKKQTAKEKRKAKKEKQQSENSDKVKEFLKKQLNTLKTELNKELNEIEAKGKSIKNNFEKFISDIKNSYKTGAGKQQIDGYCDDINNNFDQMMSTMEKISTQIPMMISKVPNPGAIGACATNPGYSVQTMITDLQTILSLFLVILSCVKKIKKGVENLKIDKIQSAIDVLTKFDLQSLIPSLNGLKSLTDSMKDMEDKVNEQKKSIEDAQKQMKKSAESLRQPIYKSGHDGDDNYIIAYKSVVLNDDLSLKGYNFYYATKTTEGKKYIVSYWLNKNNIKSTDDIPSSKMGEYYSLIYGGKIRNLQFWYFLPSSDINDNTIPSFENEISTATIENNKPNIDLSGTILTLESGKKIYLDGQYSKGDVIKLSDGTLVTIK